MERKKTILLIEDDSGSRKLMSVVLGRAGYEIIAAGDGAEAMEKTHAAQPVDLIIVDLELPDLSGGKIIRQIKDDRRKNECAKKSGSVHGALHAY